MEAFYFPTLMSLRYVHKSDTIILGNVTLTSSRTQAACVSKLKEETEKHPELADFDDQGSSIADGQSTAAVSSAGTPMASSNGPGPKLKLTFNRDAYVNGGDSGRQSDDE